MNTTHEIFVYGTGDLPCSLSQLEDTVFAKVEGFGDVTGSGSRATGWKLDLAFDSPNAFIAVIQAVWQALTDLDVDLQSVKVSIRGKSRRLVDLL